MELEVRGGLTMPTWPQEASAQPAPAKERGQGAAGVAAAAAAADAAPRAPSVAAENITFRAEPASLHGAQVLVATLLATHVVLKDTDVSWVTQLTTDRLNLLSQMFERWDGPASVTLYVADVGEALRLVEPLRRRADFHLVLADLHPNRLYPVNTLRNVAINKCRTHWMALVDADFIPNANLYQELLVFVTSIPLKDTDKSVYVLPAFQLQRPGLAVPKTKSELLSMGQAVSQVHPERGRNIAHSYTNYDKWRTASEPYTVTYQMPYEPYYLANKRVPRYDASFLGYGNDKTGQCYELWRAGIAYKVLPFAFVFHQNHPAGDWTRSDVEWTIRGPNTLDSFFNDVDDRYSTPDKKQNERGTTKTKKEEVVIKAVASAEGQNCSGACEDVALSCHASHAEKVNTCAAMTAAFGNACDMKCSDMYFGYDLPAFNTRLNKCLLNKKAKEYRLSCGAIEASSKRLCPCGPPLQNWLDYRWVHEFKTKFKLYGGKPSR